MTDRKWLAEGETLETVVETLVRSGVTCVQLREKHASDEEIISEGKKLNEICRKHHVPLIVNDRPDLAKRSVQPEFMWGCLIWELKRRENCWEKILLSGQCP